ncbi:hypothetical protein TSAR_005194 [Trichomalopsis sarcophagae]|uniref:RRM domain-containing protein n=1 Tax=Trichomalopsis sarcophagae TaxID=543379 RepID=A0A232FA73_9HYME|nr:hypothetical protein TSAR_005194 [Trichomalopsis sarcophagae]
MEMSLDDIIMQNKSSRPRGGVRGGRSPRSFRGSTSGRRPGGGVMRGRSRGGISRSSSFGARSRSSNFKREAFLGSVSPRKYGSGSDSTKLIVSNLDYGVTDSDIHELFSEFGQLRSAAVHYDKSGRSLGLANLTFERRADAIKVGLFERKYPRSTGRTSNLTKRLQAMKQYNGVPLDGREMNIELVTPELPAGSPIRAGSRLGGFKGGRGSSSSSSRPSRGGASGRSRGGRRGVAGKPGGGRQPKKAPTAEELDAELEEYVKNKVSEGA